MFHRRRSRTRRAHSSPRRRQRARQRCLSLELLEERPLLAVMTVTSLSDDTLANLMGDGQLSLREAIEAINTAAPVDGIGPTSGAFGVNDEIEFAPGLFGGGPQTINLADVAGAQQLSLTRAMTITGPGASLLTIDAGDGTDNTFNTGDGFRIFDISDGGATNSPVTLTGLTLTGGDVTSQGGAIRSVETLTVRDSVITGNAATSQGGGVYLFTPAIGGDLEITNTTMSSNASGQLGGGLFALTQAPGTVMLSGNTFARNNAESGGGAALNMSGTTATIALNRIVDNTSTMLGGGMLVASGATSTTNITSTTVSGNEAGAQGGGLFLYTEAGSSFTLSSSTIAGNQAGGNGGGMYIDAGTTNVTNSTISGNTADGFGGGIDFDADGGETLTVRYSTITNNNADNDGAGGESGGGLYLGTAGTALVENTIIAGNFDFTDTAPDIDNTSGAPDVPLTLRFSLVGINTGSDLVAANPDADGNRIGTMAAPINPNLAFLHPNGGPTDTHKLLTGSPAIDTGDPAFAVPPDNDQRGGPFIRLFDGVAPAGAVVDIGAYELQDLGGPQALVVDILADENDGDYLPGDLSLREAIGLANGNAGIAETITFAPALNGGTIVLSLGELVINDPVTINAAALAAGITIDASGNDLTPGTDDGMGTRVFDINDSTNGRIAVTLENLSITGGDVDAEGGGIRNFENLTIVSSTISANRASGDGGGIESRAGSLAIQNTTISQNEGNAGGGIHFDSLDADLTITNSTLAGNEAIGRGGGIAVDNANEVDVTSSTISGNLAGSEGGGIYLTNSGTSTILNSTLSGNDANTYGGGLYATTNMGDTTTIAHSTITDNTSDVNDDGTGSGGGLFAVTLGTLNLTHTIIAENSDLNDVAPDIDPTTNVGGAFNRTFNLIGNNLGSGLAPGNPDGNGNRIGTNAAPLNAGLGPLLDNGGPTPTHALNPGSLAIDNGNPAATAGVGGIPTFDQRGNPFTRVFDGNGAGGPRIDIGAFEVNAFELVLPDDFEPNDTLATATVLGSPPFETIRNLSITAGDGEIEPDDIDYFKYTAHYTGQLRVRIHFDDDFGDLDLQVRDMFDNQIAISNGFTDLEEIIIPVVFQEMYFIRVNGFMGDENNYTLEVENFPAPVPTGVELDPASDTGMMDNDNITSDDTPTVLVQADVLHFVDTNNNNLYQDPDTSPPGTEDLLDALSPEEVERILNGAPQLQDEDGGIAVEVTFINTTDGTFVIGFAEAVVGVLPDVYRFTPSAPLTPGVYIVTARTRVFDGQSDDAGDPDQATNVSNASPPLRLVIDTVGAAAGTISADMLDASDTGMFDDDNVTNKMQPAIQGIAPAGSKVRIFANGELVGQGVAGSDSSDVGHGVGGIGGLANDGLGLWEITVEPLADNGYDIRIEVEDAAGNVTEFDPRFNGAEERIDIVVDTLEPNTPYLDLLDDTGRHDNDNITKNNMPLFSMTTTDPNAALAQLLFTDNLKFRIFDRYESTLGMPAPEVLIYDSAQDVVADAVTTAGDMFTSETQLSKILPFLTPASPAITAGGQFAEGVHNLKLEVEDRAGNISHDFIIEVTVDTVTPPISFGLPDLVNDMDGLTATSDSGVTTVPDTFADRVTNDTTPTVWGRAEADSIVRLYLDLNANGIIDLTTDTFLGQTTAIPLDGNDAYPDGYWEITSVLDLNEIVGLPKDGVRHLLATAEDVAGNPMPGFIGNLPIIDDGVAALQIFIDTQGPRITDVNLGPGIDYDLFDPKPSTDGPTPLVHSLFIDVEDLPFRVDQAGTINDFLYEAVVEGIAETIGNYELIGDSVGQVIIEQVIVHFETVVDGQPARATIELVFSEPLPDDRYTLTVRDGIVDPAGNKLDGESGAEDPFENPTFPTGDGVPGGDFVGRFTIDSRPEIGVWAAGIIHIDTNGNFYFDPENVDFTNRDLIYTLGFSSDYIFAGNFAPIGGPADGFDKLAVYGRVGDQWRFLIDFDNDGVPDEEFIAPTINGLPVAGNFDGNAANGDEVGIFTGSAWYFDTNHDYVVDLGIASNYAGFPVVGDFDGDGDDDVATYIASQQGGNQFHIDLNGGGAGIINVNGVADHTFRIGLPGLGTFGFPGVRERPVAADMNGDGADDLGLWVPDGTTILPGDQGEWFFLLSDFERGENGGGVFVTETVIDRIIGGGIVDFVPFNTTPFGSDLYARFGNSFALPIVGNFDPPATSSGAAAQETTQSPTSSATQATQTPLPATTTTAASETDTAQAIESSPEPSSLDTSTTTDSTPSIPEPASESPASTTITTTVTAATTTTVAPTKVAVPSVAPSATTADSKSKSTKAETATKPSTKLVVPTLQTTTTQSAKQANSKSTTTGTAADTTEMAIAIPDVSSKTSKKTKKSVKVTKSAKDASKIAVPDIRQPLKVTKSAHDSVAKELTGAAPSKPAVTAKTSPATKSTKNATATTKVVSTVVAAAEISTPQLAVAPAVKTAGSSLTGSSGGSVTATIAVMPIVESATLSVASRPVVEVATLEPSPAQSSFMTPSIVRTPPPAPVFELKSAAAPIEYVQPSRKPVERPAVQSSVSNSAGSVNLQSSSLSGTLALVGADFAPSYSAAMSDTTHPPVFEPALADAALTDLLLTLADISTDADDIAADQSSYSAEADSESGQWGAGNDGGLALAVAWDSI